MFLCHDYQMSGVVSILAFTIHTVCYGLTVSNFLQIGKGFYSSGSEYFWTTFFGPGLYLSAAAGILTLISSAMTLGIYYKGRSSDYKGLSNVL
jgi:hypothetical protein